MNIDPSKLFREPRPNQQSFVTDFFSGQHTGKTIVQIPISQLTPWTDGTRAQPFRMYTATRLAEFAQDIEARGMQQPIAVRPLEMGYQILSGHNRTAAAKLAGWTTVPAIVYHLSDSDAKKTMLYGNLYQRERLLPSEKAHAYQMALEEIKHQGERTDLTSIQFDEKSKTSIEIVSSEVGESPAQIQRFIRLTYLIPSLLDAVDTDDVPVNGGVALSYLPTSCQEMLWRIMRQHGVSTLSLKQANALKGYCSHIEYLDEAAMKDILKIAPPATPRVKPLSFKLSPDFFNRDIPKSLCTDTELLMRISRVVEDYAHEKGVSI